MGVQRKIVKKCKSLCRKDLRPMSDNWILSRFIGRGIGGGNASDNILWYPIGYRTLWNVR